MGEKTVTMFRFLLSKRKPKEKFSKTVHHSPASGSLQEGQRNNLRKPLSIEKVHVVRAWNKGTKSLGYLSDDWDAPFV